MRSSLAVLIVTISLLTISACSGRSINLEHEEYLEELGWKVQSFESEETIELDLYPETVDSYHASNIHFLDEHIDTEVLISNYTLKQLDDGGEPIQVTIYEKNNEILGAIGVLPSWTPEVFNIADKDRLMYEGLLE